MELGQREEPGLACIDRRCLVDIIGGMRIYFLVFTVMLQGCAAFSRRNFVELENQRPAPGLVVTDRPFPVGEVDFDNGDYRIRIINRNSNTSFLSVGPLLPVVPASPFRHLTANGILSLEFIVETKTEKAPPPSLDFSGINFEDFPNNYHPCQQFTVTEILQFHASGLEFLNPLLAHEKTLSHRLYQLTCHLAGRSIPEVPGTFLKIKGVKVATTKAGTPLSDLIFTYRNTYQYEFFAP